MRAMSWWVPHFVIRTLKNDVSLFYLSTTREFFLKAAQFFEVTIRFHSARQRPETYNDNWGMVVEKVAIYNGNWTEWSAIWTEIIYVILKSDQNCKTRNSITILLQPFWNRRIQSTSIFIWSSSPSVEKQKHLKRPLHLIFYSNRNDVIESKNDVI